MKPENYCPKVLLLIAVLHLTCFISIAQTWTQIASLPSVPRDQNMGFSINGKGYICGGNTGGTILKETWEYDPVTDAWTQKANMPQKNNGAATFTIGNFGYVIGGYNYTNNELNVLWRYNPSTNAWTNKTPFTGPRDNGALSWSINGKGYVGCGWSGTGYTSDVWEYNPTTDAWTQIASFPGGNRAWVVSFVVNNIGYAGLGEYPSFNGLSDFYSYNPVTNLWSTCSNFPGIPRVWSLGLAINDKGYTGGGASSSTMLLSDWWQYDPANNGWQQLCDYGGGTRAIGAAFTINNTGYFGTGRSASTPILENDFWKFEPDSQAGPVITGDTVLCAGDTIQLTASGAATYLWNTGDTTATIFAAPITSQIFSVSTSSGNCITADSVWVTVFPLPLQPGIIYNADTLFCADSAAQYQWYLNGNAIPGAQQSYLTNLVYGTYTVAVIDSNGCSTLSKPFILSAVSSIYNSNCFNAWFDHNQLNLKHCYVNKNEELVITIFGSEGRKVAEFTTELHSGTSVIQMPLPSLGNGVYLIRIKGASIAANLKLMIKG
ncbi:MAG: kelch repeat-containing protein [Bacteroidia bacterium]